MNQCLGELELDVPQVRGCEPYSPSLFNKWQRSERALLVACGEMYFQGVSDDLYDKHESANRRKAVEIPAAYVDENRTVSSHYRSVLTLT
jgi:transposase-like protein